MEIKIKRISKFDSFRADELIKGFEDEIEEVKGYLSQMTRYTIRYFKELIKKYGKGRERKTELSIDENGELSAFDKIVASKVVVASETLFINRKDGFAGYGLKRMKQLRSVPTLMMFLLLEKMES